MTKVNPNNGNETKSGIFPWESSTSMTFKIKISKFYDYSEPKQQK